MRGKVWSSANSLFKWRFRSRRRRCCLSSLVSSLSVVFAYETHVGEKINFDERVVKMKKVLNLWSGRRLSILGRIAIVKTLALSKLVPYNFSVLDTPTDFAKEVNKVSLIKSKETRWQAQSSKVALAWSILPWVPEVFLACGGNFRCWPKPETALEKSLAPRVGQFRGRRKSLKAAWVNRYCSSEGHHWCALLDSHLERFGCSFLFKCNYDLKFLDLEGLPLFYRNILTVWQIRLSKVPLSVNEIKEEKL